VLSQPTAELLSRITVRLALTAYTQERRVRELVTLVGDTEERARRRQVEWVELQSKLETQSMRAIAELQNANAELQAANAVLVAARDALRSDLDLVYSTKGWRASVAYWRMRREGARGPFLLAGRLLRACARAGYRATVPLGIRRAFWYRRNPGKGHAASRVGKSVSSGGR